MSEIINTMMPPPDEVAALPPPDRPPGKPISPLSVKYGKAETIKLEVIARYYKVSITSVRKWIDKGLLESYKIPGGTHRRVTRRAFEQFTKQYPKPPL